MRTIMTIAMGIGLFTMVGCSCFTGSCPEPKPLQKPMAVVYSAPPAPVCNPCAVPPPAPRPLPPPPACSPCGI